MTPVYVDATPHIALGAVGELELLLAFDGPVVVPPAVRREVTTEPARTNLRRLLDRPGVRVASEPPDSDRAMRILGESTVTGDVSLVAAVLERTDADEPVAIVSDDRRVRTVTRGLGATVTGTIGVVVRAVGTELSAEAAKSLVRRIDDDGLHLTGELRATADRLIEGADGPDRR